MRPTAFGEQFVARAKQILRAVDEIEDLARSAQDGLTGRFRLGVIPTIAPYLLPSVIAELADRNPDLDVHVRETITPRLIDELGQGMIDAAIVALPVSEPWLASAPLFSEDLVLVRPGTEVSAPLPSRDALRDMRLLLLEEGHCFRDQALAFCNLSPTRPREGLDGTSLSTLVQMVGAGIGVTLIPEMAVDVETRSAPVCIQRFKGAKPARKIAMVWRKTTPLVPQLEALADMVRDVADARNAHSAPSG